MLTHVDTNTVPHIDIKPAAASLYVGTVMHARLKPFLHRFNYSVFNLMIDIDRLNKAGRQSKLLAINRRGVTSFYESDHGDGRSNGLGDHIRSLLNEAQVKEKPDEILLLCYPRVLGYVFNPISIYYCWRDQHLIAMIYEVRNTFGGKHIYVKAVEDGQFGPAGLKQECDKIFHVSPFIKMKMTYFFRLTKPGADLSFRILEKDDEGPLLSAAFRATHLPLTTRNIAKLLLKIPFLTLKVISGIHFEAFRIWVKGAKFHPNPHKIV